MKLSLLLEANLYQSLRIDDAYKDYAVKILSAIDDTQGKNYAAWVARLINRGFIALKIGDDVVNRVTDHQATLPDDASKIKELLKTFSDLKTKYLDKLKASNISTDINAYPNFLTLKNILDELCTKYLNADLPGCDISQHGIYTVFRFSGGGGVDLVPKETVGSLVKVSKGMIGSDTTNSWCTKYPNNAASYLNNSTALCTIFRLNKPYRQFHVYPIKRLMDAIHNNVSNINTYTGALRYLLSVSGADNKSVQLSDSEAIELYNLAIPKDNPDYLTQERFLNIAHELITNKQKAIQTLIQSSEKQFTVDDKSYYIIPYNTSLLSALHTLNFNSGMNINEIFVLVTDNESSKYVSMCRFRHYTNEHVIGDIKNNVPYARILYNSVNVIGSDDDIREVVIKIGVELGILLSKDQYDRLVEQFMGDRRERIKPYLENSIKENIDNTDVAFKMISSTHYNQFSDDIKILTNNSWPRYYYDTLSTCMKTYGRLVVAINLETLSISDVLYYHKNVKNIKDAGDDYDKYINISIQAIMYLGTTYKYKRAAAKLLTHMGIFLTKEQFIKYVEEYKAKYQQSRLQYMQSDEAKILANKDIDPRCGIVETNWGNRIPFYMISEDDNYYLIAVTRDKELSGIWDGTPTRANNGLFYSGRAALRMITVSKRNIKNIKMPEAAA